MKSFSRSRRRRGVSPIIAAVILVAVAITISIASAYWMGGIAGQFTKHESIEVQTGYSTKGASGWTVTLQLKNTGSAAATLIQAFVDDVPLNATQYDQSTFGTSVNLDQITTDFSSSGTVVTSGNNATIHIYIPFYYGSLSSGTTCDVKIHSAGGIDYIKMIGLS